jgi:hypothetical protein
MLAAEGDRRWQTDEWGSVRSCLRSPPSYGGRWRLSFGRFPQAAEDADEHPDQRPARGADEADVSALSR